jgi:thioredoxin-related protein
MKYRILTVILSFCSFILPARAQFDTAIHFNQYSWNEIFEYAKIYNKPVMLYFHIDGCGACIQMERTAFKQKDIYSFINGNFLVYNINTQKGEGIEINKRYNIVLNPTILFVNQKGNITDRVEGYPGMVTLYERLHRAVDKNKLYDYFKKDYKNGRRNADFLYQYVYAMDANGDLDSNTVILEYLATQKPKDLTNAKNMSFIYDFMYYDHKVMIDSKTDAYLAMYNNKALFMKYFPPGQVTSRLIFVLYSELAKSCGGGGGDYDRLYNLIKAFHGTERITYEEDDGTISEGISRIDSNTVRVDYSRCLFTR